MNGAQIGLHLHLYNLSFNIQHDSARREPIAGYCTLCWGQTVPKLYLWAGHQPNPITAVTVSLSQSTALICIFQCKTQEATPNSLFQQQKC